MKCKVIFSPKATAQLKKLDNSQRAIILKWISKNLVGTENPKERGKALSNDMRGFWRYRVGDYRLIAEIHKEEVIISVVNIGHRSEVYKL
jgi:mRNA interferase RelE/StbE